MERAGCERYGWESSQVFDAMMNEVRREEEIESIDNLKRERRVCGWHTGSSLVGQHRGVKRSRGDKEGEFRSRWVIPRQLLAGINCCYKKMPNLYIHKDARIKRGEAERYQRKGVEVMRRKS
jgi:hypothetical protein